MLNLILTKVTGEPRVYGDQYGGRYFLIHRFYPRKGLNAPRICVPSSCLPEIIYSGDFRQNGKIIRIREKTISPQNLFATTVTTLLEMNEVNFYNPPGQSHPVYIPEAGPRFEQDVKPINDFGGPRINEVDISPEFSRWD